MRLRVDLTASVAKDPQQAELNEDAWAANEPGTCIAVADGASESYDSRAWAQLLVRAYVQDQGISAQWVADRVQAYLATVDYLSLSWSQQAGFDRGSFGTLLGLGLAANGRDAEVLAIGDSLAVHVRQNVLVASFPFTEAEQFDARPQLLSTLSAANDFVSDSEFFKADSSCTWVLEPGDLVFLVTDAVGHWLLSEAKGGNAVQVLSDIDSLEDFESLVVAMRQERRMRLDDSTLIRVVVDEEEDETVAKKGADEKVAFP